MATQPAERGASTDTELDEKERRVAPRLGANDVPWIKEIKPTLRSSARLVNISQTGVLLDTTQRLVPGCRTTLTLNTANGQVEKVDALVVRTDLVAIGERVAPLYRMALRFTTELSWSLAEGPEGPKESDAASDCAEELAVSPRLVGPLDGLLSTEHGAHVVAIENVTEAGCTLTTVAELVIDEWISVSVFFSQLRRKTVTGKIVALTPGRSCTVHFEHLTVEERRALRGEIRSQVTRPRMTASLVAIESASELDAASPDDLASPFLPYDVTTQSNQW